jgi:ribosomal protein L6P/L9E
MTTWYLAEGCTAAAGSFETWVLVQNPQSVPVDVALTYMTPSGKVDGPRETLAPNSRNSYNVASTVNDAWEVSTKVEATQPVIAERAMYGSGRTWAHDSIGASSPQTTWYMAEGCTSPGFETWVLVQNPNDTTADVTLTFMTPNGAVAGPQDTLTPNSRKTYNVAKTVGEIAEVSTMVESSGAGVVAERAMYGSNRVWGTDSIGTSSPMKTWYLAEGCTSAGFETWVLVANPNEEPAEVTITYMTSSGAVEGPREVLAPNSRKSYNVAATVNNAWEVSTRVESPQWVIAERAMYGNGRTWAHDSVGAGAPSTLWYLAEGSTGPGFETWILVQNPNSQPALIRITYMTPNGAVAGPYESLPANSRKSYNVASTVPNTTEVSTRVEADFGVIAERAMYGDPK